jgi:hypothetical protein
MPRKKRASAGVPSGEYLLRPSGMFQPAPSERETYEEVRRESREGRFVEYSPKGDRLKQVVREAKKKGEREREYGVLPTFVEDQVKTRFRGQSRGLPMAKKKFRSLAKLWSR